MDDSHAKHPPHFSSNTVPTEPANRNRNPTTKLRFTRLKPKKRSLSNNTINETTLRENPPTSQRIEVDKPRSLDANQPIQSRRPEPSESFNDGTSVSRIDSEPTSIDSELNRGVPSLGDVDVGNALQMLSGCPGIDLNLQQLIDAVPSAVWIKNCANVIVGANSAALQACGLSRDELIGKSSECIYGELGKKYCEEDLEVIQSGRPKHNIIDPFVINGQQKWIRTTKTPIRDGNGSVIGVIVVSDDISGELQTVEDLRNTNREFEGLFDSINYGMAGVTTSGRLHFSNRRFDEMLDCAPVDLRRKITLADRSIFDYLPLQPFNERTLARLAENNASGKRKTSLSYRTTCRRRNKSEFPASIKISNVRRYGSDFLLVEVYDETEIIRATERLRMTLECADAACWEIDLQKQTLSLVLGSAEKFGFDNAVQPLKTWKSLIHKEDQALTKQTIRQAILNANNRFSVVFRARQSDGSYSSTLFRGEITRDLQGRVLSIIGVHIDIDRQVTMETELREALQNQRRLNSDLDSFAYAVSHDLKAPLRGVKNIANLLVSDPENELSSEGQELCDLLNSRIVRMEDMLADVLAFSRSGFGNGKSEPVDTLKIVWNLFRDVNADSNCQLEHSGNLPEFETLRVPFEQVFRNLLSNAVNYSQGQLPVIHVGCEERANSYLFSVSDSGPGIEEKFHERIFLPFKTLHRSSDNGGTGLGLALARKQVQAVGGAIWVESVPGQGATFKFEWPKILQQN